MTDAELTTSNFVSLSWPGLSWMRERLPAYLGFRVNLNNRIVVLALLENILVLPRGLEFAECGEALAWWRDVLSRILRCSQTYQL